MFLFWQLAMPELERTHSSSMIEIRESSKKTKENGKKRIWATLIAIGVNPFRRICSTHMMWEKGWTNFAGRNGGALRGRWAMSDAGFPASIAVILKNFELRLSTGF